MLGFLTRILRVFWRPETEGSGGAVVLTFPNPESETLAQTNPLPAAPVAFLRRSGETASTIQKPSTRHLAARLQSVQRLNSPTSRSCRKAAMSPAPHLKSARAVTPGVVLKRLATHSRRTSAEIVNLSDVRRNRQVETMDRDIAAIFN
ncbi:MAG: hypothetical protein K2Q28_12520 [Hyphomicrobium sp.]|nr:hypothetical protein [Hyphomicrobium sp.]